MCVSVCSNVGLAWYILCDVCFCMQQRGARVDIGMYHVCIYRVMCVCLCMFPSDILPAYIVMCVMCDIT